MKATLPLPLQRGAVALTLVSFVSAISVPASAQDAERCVTLHTSGQDSREKGRWVAARENFVQCALDSCPSVVREECAKLLASLDASMPTVVFQARDAAGRPTSQVEVRLGSKVFLPQLKPTAVPIDPGQHTFTFRTTDGTSVQQQVTAVEGQKNQLVGIDFAPRKQDPVKAPGDAGAESSMAGIPVGAYVLGAVAVVGLGSFGYFSLTGKSKQSDLEGSCAPRCSDSDYDDMQRNFVIADVSLGVALVAGGLATWLVLGSSKEATQVGVQPMRSGAAASMIGHF